MHYSHTETNYGNGRRPAGRGFRGPATVQACAGIAIAACLAAAAPTPALAGAFPAEFDLSTLDGANGFIIDGVGDGSLTGYSVSGAGDVNGDGIADIIIGAPSEIAPSGAQVGMAYVVFGRDRGFPAQSTLSTLDGTNGFAIAGIADGDFNGESTGFTVSDAGDVNGDGYDDIIVEAPYADANGVIDAGRRYVVFGAAGGFPAVFELSTLDGANGFALNGISQSDAAGFLGQVSGAGDVNGDGFGDIVIGAPRATPYPPADPYPYINPYALAGQSYVVFGAAAGFPAKIDLAALDGTNGFTVNGYGKLAESGSGVSAAGDLNADGFDDFIIGAPGYGAGKAYVIFGTDLGFPAVLELSAIDGLFGFALNGATGYGAGASVSAAGDVNGDRIDDIVIGSSWGEQSYVVFGSGGGFPALFELSSLDGSNGFTLTGSEPGAQFGISVSGAGDFNGDGIADIVIGAGARDLYGKVDVGRGYVVFGTDQGFPALIAESALNGTNGFALNGVNENSWAGLSVSGAGDVNADGVDDIVIGASSGVSADGLRTGQSYVVFGRRVPALTVSGVCPGTVTANISRATPGGKVWLLHSAAQGATVVPSGRCARTVLDLAGPTLASQRTADATGSILELMPTTAAACGRFVQVVDAMTCTPSNVAQLP